MDKAGNSSVEIVRTALNDGDEARGQAQSSVTMMRKTSTYSLLATVTDNFSIKEYWAEARFSGSPIGGLAIADNLFLPREGAVAVDAYNAPTLTQATLASVLHCADLPSHPDGLLTFGTSLRFGVFASDNADNLSNGALGTC